MDNSFYLKNGAVLWNGAFTPVDLAVEDGAITAVIHPASWISTPTGPPGWT